VYSRDLDGELLTFAASGWTWNGVFILQDHQTGSLWFTGRGVAGDDQMLCVAGLLQDAKLPQLPFMRLAWKSFVSGFPHATFPRIK
jgi:hypothetical protein